MVINQNGSTKGVSVNTLNTIIDQISALQEDLALLQSNVASFANSFETRTLNANVAAITNATIGTETVTNSTINTANISNLTASTGAITNLRVSKTLNASAITGATNVNATNLNGTNLNVSAATIGALTVSNGINTTSATLSNGLTASAITAPTITATTLNAPTVNATTMATKVIKADKIVSTETVNARDITASNIDVLGVADIETLETKKVNTHTVTAETINAGDVKLVKSVVEATPALDNNDTYTVVVQPFNGETILTWVNDNSVVWSVVIESASGKGFNFIWNCNTTNTIEKIYQYNDKLYIVTNSNGGLKSSVISSENIVAPTILFNAEEPSDATYDIEIETDNGTAMFNDTIYYQETTLDDFESRIDAVEELVQTYENRFNNLNASTANIGTLAATNATLNYATINGGSFTGTATLSNANINGGVITGVSQLTANNTNLRNANLNNATIQNASIKGGTIEDASYINVSSINSDTATIKTLVGLVQIV